MNERFTVTIEHEGETYHVNYSSGPPGTDRVSKVMVATTHARASGAYRHPGEPERIPTRRTLYDSYWHPADKRVPRAKESTRLNAVLVKAQETRREAGVTEGWEFH